LDKPEKTDIGEEVKPKRSWGNGTSSDREEKEGED